MRCLLQSLTCSSAVHNRGPCCHCAPQTLSPGETERELRDTCQGPLLLFLPFMGAGSRQEALFELAQFVVVFCCCSKTFCSKDSLQTAFGGACLRHPLPSRGCSCLGSDTVSRTRSEIWDQTLKCQEAYWPLLFFPCVSIGFWY